jgi:hypothetical protein
MILDVAYAFYILNSKPLEAALFFISAACVGTLAIKLIDIDKKIKS